MAKAILIVVAVMAGGGLAFQSVQLSKKIDEQDQLLQRLRGQISLLESGEATPEAADRTFDTSFDLPENTLARTTDVIDDEELRSLVARLVKDDAVVGAIARKVETQIDPGQALISSAAFRDGVKTTMEELEELEREERNARRTEQMMARTEERAKEIAEKLKLPPQTAEELTNIMIESAEARTDMFTLMRSGEIDRGDMRDVMREQRDETNALVQDILTATEYEEYTKLQEENRGGFGGFGGGRGGRGGGGGGNTATPTTTNGDNGGSTTTPTRRRGRGGF